MPLSLKSSGGGSVTLDTPSTASTYTLTVPAITGTAVVTGSSGTVSQAMLAAGVAGNGPAFSAVSASNQSVTTQTITKVTFGTEEFDTGNCFASSRFTPTVAGYYQINSLLRGTGTSISFISNRIYKNGSQIQVISSSNSTAGSANAFLSCIVYLNGSTDYIEVYGSITATGPSFAGDECFFSGCLVRSA